MPPQTSNYVIKENSPTLEEWMLPLISAFDSSLEACTNYAQQHAKALQNSHLQHFSLYQAQQPVASLTLSQNNQLARIDDVGTTSEFQGKGYATALLQHTLSAAQKSGAHYCFLEASTAGLSIYQTLGFALLFENNIYTYRA